MDYGLGQYQALLQNISQNRTARAAALQQGEQQQMNQQPQMPPWAYQEMLNKMGYPSPRENYDEEKRRWDATYANQKSVSDMTIEELRASIEAHKAENARLAAQSALAGKTFEQATLPQAQATTANQNAQTASWTNDTSQSKDFHPLKMEGQRLTNRSTAADLAPKEATAVKFAPRKPLAGGRGYLKEDGTRSMYPNIAEEEANYRKVWGGTGVNEKGEAVVQPGIAQTQPSWNKTPEDIAYERTMRDKQKQAMNEVLGRTTDPLQRLELLSKGTYTEKAPPDNLTSITRPGDRTFQGTYDIGKENSNYTLPGQSIPGELRGARKPTTLEQMYTKDPKGATQLQKTKANNDAKATRDAANNKARKEIKDTLLTWEKTKWDNPSEKDKALLDIRRKEFELKAKELGLAINVAKVNTQLQAAGLKQREVGQLLGFFGKTFASQSQMKEVMDNLPEQMKLHGDEWMKKAGIEIQQAPPKPVAGAPQADVPMGGANSEALNNTIKNINAKFPNNPAGVVEAMKKLRASFVENYGQDAYNFHMKRYGQRAANPSNQ